jgi:hypothetical protein
MRCNIETVIFDRTERVQELKLEIELAAELIQHWKDQNCAAGKKKGVQLVPAEGVFQED